MQNGDCLKEASVVLLEQLRTIDKCRLNGYVGSLDKASMKEVDHALAVSVGLSGEGKY
ncbi:MAG: type II toxin-antitoxin system PemK/MazF family toxin [Lachnospiraceae bacterium]|nr:type II toxin-antitoxin system PemK/MazF family toxin [Lachnospiraceae bacterium]